MSTRAPGKTDLSAFLVTTFAPTCRVLAATSSALPAVPLCSWWCLAVVCRLRARVTGARAGRAARGRGAVARGREAAGGALRGEAACRDEPDRVAAGAAGGEGDDGARPAPAAFDGGVPGAAPAGAEARPSALVARARRYGAVRTVPALPARSVARTEKV